MVSSRPNAIRNRMRASASRTHLGAALAIVLGALWNTPASAEAPIPVAGAGIQIDGQWFVVPGTSVRFQAGSASSSIREHEGGDALLRALLSWIADNSALPRVTSVPLVAFSSSRVIAAEHAAGLVGWQQVQSGNGNSTDLGSVVSVYDRRTRTVHLPAEWTGQTPQEISVLVHELVHYLQHVAELKFQCPQAQEEAAYAIQQKWLALFSHDLMKDFNMDPFTLLVRTTCFN